MSGTLVRNQARVSLINSAGSKNYRENESSPEVRAFLSEQLYKNNEAQIGLKLRTI